MSTMSASWTMSIVTTLCPWLYHLALTQTMTRHSFSRTCHLTRRSRAQKEVLLLIQAIIGSSYPRDSRAVTPLTTLIIKVWELPQKTIATPSSRQRPSWVSSKKLTKKAAKATNKRWIRIGLSQRSTLRQTHCMMNLCCPTKPTW